MLSRIRHSTLDNFYVQLFAVEHFDVQSFKLGRSTFSHLTFSRSKSSARICNTSIRCVAVLKPVLRQS
jgi:hypothetical protein